MRSVGREQTYSLGRGDWVGYGDAGGDILRIAELSKYAVCMTGYIQVKMSDTYNTTFHKVALSRLCSHCMETQLHL